MRTSLQLMDFFVFLFVLSKGVPPHPLSSWLFLSFYMVLVAVSQWLLDLFGFPTVILAFYFIWSRKHSSSLYSSAEGTNPRIQKIWNGVNALFVPTFWGHFYFGPYIFILPLLVPNPINACYFSSFCHSTNRKPDVANGTLK